MAVSRKKSFMLHLKRLIMSFFSVPLMNAILKLILKPFTSLGFLDPKLALNIPARGVFQVRLPSGEAFTLSNDGNDRVANALYWKGISGYEYETTTAWIEMARRSKVIFDIGAYSGLYSLLAASVNPQARIFAFEPFPPTYQTLIKNITLNHFDQISAHQEIVNDKVGVVDLYIPSFVQLPTSPTIKADFNRNELQETLRANSTSVDAFRKKHQLERCDLVKIDVESAEQSVLEGMRETLQIYSPAIIMEILFGKNENFLNQFLKPLGYNFYWLTTEGAVKQDVVRGDPNYKFFNFLIKKD